MDELSSQYDVVVIGGGAAGLSGALTLARARRSVLVIDAGQQRNLPATGMHGFLTRDGLPPRELVALGRAEVEGYGGTVVDSRVTSLSGTVGAFRVTLADGRTVSARRLLVTTGLVDELPAVPGVRELWGTDVIHCPYCHGYEVRDQPLGVLAGGAIAVHLGQLFRQWTPDVTLFLNGGERPSDEDMEGLAARRVTVVEDPVEALEIEHGRLTGVRLAGGEVVPRRVLAVATRLVARADVLAGIGLEPVEHPMGVRIEADETGRTAVPGVWAAGNVTALQAQVVLAAGDGMWAGAQINADLVAEEVRGAVEQAQLAAWAERHGDGDPYSRQFWDDRYASRDQVWSGKANAALVAEASELPAGRALDAGCGEGGDAIWLAARGWDVTAVDVSPVGLERAAEHAGELASRIDFQQADFRDWTPEREAYDLVTAHFLHPMTDVRTRLVAGLAAAVAPGGTLLYVGHDPSDLGVVPRGPRMLMPTAQEIAGMLDPDAWEIEVAEARPRPHKHPDGHEVTIHDAVLRARRR